MKKQMNVWVEESLAAELDARAKQEGRARGQLAAEAFRLYLDGPQEDSDFEQRLSRLEEMARGQDSY